MDKKYSKRETKLNLNKNLVVNISARSLKCYFKTIEDSWEWFKSHNIKLIEQGDWFELSRKNRMNLCAYFYNNKNKNLTKKQFINLMLNHRSIMFRGDNNNCRYYASAYNDKTIYNYHEHKKYWTPING